MKKNYMVLIGFLVFSVSAYSQISPKIELENQNVLIEEGIKKGHLTKAESQQLYKERKRIDTIIKKGVTDKKFTKKAQSQAIALLKRRKGNIEKMLNNSVRPLDRRITKGLSDQNVRIQEGIKKGDIAEREISKIVNWHKKIHATIIEGIADKKFTMQEIQKTYNLVKKSHLTIKKHLKNSDRAFVIEDNMITKKQEKVMQENMRTYNSMMKPLLKQMFSAQQVLERLK
jgi:hypothetical protein